MVRRIVYIGLNSGRNAQLTRSDQVTVRTVWLCGKSRAECRDQMASGLRLPISTKRRVRRCLIFDELRQIHVKVAVLVELTLTLVDMLYRIVAMMRARGEVAELVTSDLERRRQEIRLLYMGVVVRR